jgi:hypothetical protein
MRVIVGVIVLLGSVSFAASAEKADPVTDRMRYEIAAAQRDYLIAKQQLDIAAAQLRTGIEAGNKACEAAAKIFSVDSLACVDKPKQTEK